jgi:hypothetical protein
MPAPREITDLVARFEQQLDAYKSGGYNEAQLRLEFLDPFFKALGWDVANTEGYAEQYKDVISEDAIRISGATKAPDYCFRIGGTRKFFLEAKKPSVDIKADVSPAHQLRSYAWSAKLPLSILSDFEEFAVYDCRLKPRKDDPASVGRIFYCTFREYAEKWDWIHSIFSRDAVLKGSFDKFAESTRGKRGTTEVDAAFLEEIEGWRKRLAENLALRNPRLTQRELNFAVQRIIDRIIFLRICEDRGIEDYGRLRALVNGDRIYPRLTKLFEEADARYNSGIFHFKKEPGRHEAPDELTLDLDLDDKLLRDILRGLYYPDSPYQFSVLSADILGQVYEQFLGKVIRLTEGHRAVVDDKPEVKKAGGVYYTPTYIVDYIVRQTVGKLLEEIAGRNFPPSLPSKAGGEGRGEEARTKSPPLPDPLPPLGGEGIKLPSARSAAAILNRVAKIKILDPACGSGSFLIGAYQFLLDWHLQFYLANHPEKWARGAKPALVQTGKGWKLTIDARKRILLDHIYGVDIDSQAVEVTKLSLLLKVLEGETGQTLQTILRIFQERALPDLGDNIKCGNSLIGPDFYRQAELPLLTDDEKYRINVFDWHAEFPQIFRSRRREPAHTGSGELREAAAVGELDYTTPGVPLHGGFSYKQMKGAKAAPPPAPTEPEWEGGFDAVIGNPPYVQIENIPAADRDYFISRYGENETLGKRYDIYQVFLLRAISLQNEQGKLGFILPNTFLVGHSYELLRRRICESCCIREIVDLPQGVFIGVTVDNVLLFLQREHSPQGRSANKIAVNKLNETSNKSRVATREWDDSFALSQAAVQANENHDINIHGNPTLNRLFEKLERGGVCLGDVTDSGQGIILYETSRQAEKSEHTGFKKQSGWKRLLRGKEIGRYQLTWKGEYVNYGRWLWRAREERFFNRPKILLHAMRNKSLERRLVGTFDPGVHYNAHNLANIILKENCPYDLKFILGIFNSRLINFWYKGHFPNVNINPNDFRRIPIRPINFSNKSDKAAHDRMVQLVEQMLELHRQLAAARTPQEQTALERQIAATDAEIDRLVYQLYGLTDDEINIVEQAAK